MNRSNMPAFSKILFIIPAVLTASGCLSVKTEHEVKPIHITMDINLKIDKELDNAFGEQAKLEKKERFQKLTDLLERGVAGITNRAYLEKRGELTPAEEKFVRDDNNMRREIYASIAEKSQSTVDAVEKRRAERIRELLADGSRIWYQDNDGNWLRK